MAKVSSSNKSELTLGLEIIAAKNGGLDSDYSLSFDSSFKTLRGCLVTIMSSSISSTKKSEFFYSSFADSGQELSAMNYYGVYSANPSRGVGLPKV